MYGQVISMEHTLTADNRIRETVQSVDPQEAWLEALSKVERMFRLLEQRYNVSAADFYNFLQQHEEKLYSAIAAAWDALDGDVVGRYEEGCLTPQQWQMWRQSLLIWKRLLSAGVQLFRVHLLNPDQADVMLEWPKAA
jgi:hypothetical protein